MTRIDDCNEVYPGIWVSNIHHARETDLDRYDRIVTVCEDTVPVPLDVEYAAFCMADGVERPGSRGEVNYTIFADAARTVLAGIGNDDDTLVHCHAGVSRSASVTAAAIGTAELVTYYEALGRIKESRPRVGPHRNLRDLAKAFIENHTDVNHTGWTGDVA